MPARSTFVKLTLLLPAKDHGAYVAAARLLAQIMGRKAPAVIGLILHDLRGRDATGIADDYLDSVRWPRAAGRVVTLRRHDFSPLRRSSRRLSGSGSPPDPSLN